MEKRDYLLLEIEKIGQMLNMIISKLTGRDNGTTTNTERVLEETATTLKDEFDFDLNAFLKMGQQDSLKYMSNFKSFDTNNIELLAQILVRLRTMKGIYGDNLYLEKALMLYEYCSEKDKTFSFDRENKILEIKAILEN